MITSLVLLAGMIAAPAVAQEDVSRASKPELKAVLALLAKKASLHQDLLYRFQCTEDVTRSVKRKSTFSQSGFRPEGMIHERFGIVLERGDDGVARAIRVKVKRDGAVRLDRKGQPVEISLPTELRPISSAAPHAQAVLFDEDGQSQLVFRFPERSAASDDYRISCPDGGLALEFMDRDPPQLLSECSGGASGQICVDPEGGEITRIVYYGLDRTENGCEWNRAAPFAFVEQGTVEPRTGARFPSRVRTILSINRRDDAVFDQSFEQCVFTNVETKATVGTIVETEGP